MSDNHDPLFEPYHKDDGAWDWKIISLATALIGARSLEALLGGVAIIILIVVLLATLFILYLNASFIYGFYKKYALTRSRSTLILWSALLLLVAIWCGCFVAWYQGQMDFIQLVNILAASLLSYTLTLFGIEWWLKRTVTQTPPALEEGRVTTLDDVAVFTADESGVVR